MYMSRTSKKPIYQQIQEHLQELLDTGELRAGDQIPSERRLMADFTTSNMPVRQAVQHFIDKGRFERVHGRGTFVCRQQNHLTGRIAVLYVFDNAGMWSSPFYTEIMRGIEDGTIEHDLRLIMQSVGDQDIHALMCRLEDEVDGFLILDAFPSMIERIEKYGREKRKPLVVVNYPHHWTQVDSVLTDNVHNSQILTEYLINAGHRRIAVLYQYSMMGSMRELHPSYILKIQGYKQALALHDIPLDESLIIEVNKAQSETLLADLQHLKATAIFCTGSHLVRKLLPQIKQSGFSVPDDCSLVAYDRSRDVTEADPAITVIDTRLNELGQTASRRLYEKINARLFSSSTMLLQGQVLEGQSVSPPKGLS